MKISKVRSFSAFDSKVNVADGLITVTKDRKKLDKSLVTLLVKLGKAVTMAELATEFNKVHTNKVTYNHVRHSIKSLIASTDGIINVVGKKVVASRKAQTLLGKVAYEA